MASNPTSLQDVEQLEQLLSEPTRGAIQAVGALDGDIAVLGVGGKMGPTLARMAKMASEMAGVKRRVIGVARFSSPTLERRLRAWGVETVRCDLLDNKALSRLPDAANVIFMAGMKFGTMGQEPLTWAINSFLPGLVADRCFFDGKCLRSFSHFQGWFERGRRSKSFGGIRDELRWA